MTILLLTATEKEQLKKELPTGVFYKTTGMGQVNAASHAALYIEKYRPDLVVLLGACGSLSQKLKQGDIVIGNKFINGDYDFTVAQPDFKKDVIENKNKIVQQLNLKYIPATFHILSTFSGIEKKKELDGGDVIDMESFAVAQTCEKFGIDYVICKVVSDNLDGNAAHEWNTFMDTVYNVDELFADIIKDYKIEKWENHIASIMHFPKQGVNFRDIATLLVNPEMTRRCVTEWIASIEKNIPEFDKIAVVDSRGFLFGSMIAQKLGKGLILIRKKGKLPPEVISESYSMEYSEQKTLELRTATVNSGEKVLIIDDFIATGGTIKACVRLLKKVGAEVVGISCLATLDDLYKEKDAEGVKFYTLLDLK